MQIIERMEQRVERTRSDSDAAYFQDLLLLGELLVKTHVATLLAALDDDKGRNRYRLEHRLVRADSIGVWVESGIEILSGPAYIAVANEAKPDIKQLTTKGGAGTWQFAAAEGLWAALECLGMDNRPRQTKASFIHWLEAFAALRNKTRGHGALLPTTQGALCDSLSSSFNAICGNSPIFDLEYAFLKQNFSGKFRVSRISETDIAFSEYKVRTDLVANAGVYVCWGEIRPIRLIYSDPDLTDFFTPNGDYKSDSFESLSYISGDTKRQDSTPFRDQPSHLPPSATEGLADFDSIGSCWANLPPKPGRYIERPGIDEELNQVLTDERHPVITLVGRGGVGKTYSALWAVHNLAHSDNADLIVWFSSRDIELEERGPKPVKAHLLGEEDIAREFTRLLGANQEGRKGFDHQGHFAEELRKSTFGKAIYVFDNFETANRPADLYSWINSNIRLPNKALITTRHRDFKGDYHIDVEGMSHPEARELIESTWVDLKSPFQLSEPFIEQLIDESSGHPYVLKILLGEAARDGAASSVKRVLAKRDDVLQALFERTFAAVSFPAQRVFLTLCAWRSVVPEILLEVVLNRPENERMDFGRAVRELEMHSFIAATETADGQRFFYLPLPAFLFGRQKLGVSPLKTTIQQDVELLQLAGAGTQADAGRGVEARIETLFRRVARIVDKGERSLDDFLPILESVARGLPIAWKWLADLALEELDSPRGNDLAVDYLQRYLETSRGQPNQSIAWKQLADLYSSNGDMLGMHHALVEMCTLPDTPFFVLTDTANRLNALPKEKRHSIERETYRGLMRTIAEAIENRIRAEGESGDYSKLGWLWLHAGDEARAGQVVNQGLAIEPDEQHCLNLQERLSRGRERLH